MKPVPFTQYLMPSGERRATSIDVGDAEFAQWEKIRAMGFTMGVEMLSDWITVSLTIECRELELDYDIALADNGPAVPKALSELFLRFDPVAAGEWLNAQWTRQEGDWEETAGDTP